MRESEASSAETKNSGAVQTNGHSRMDSAFMGYRNGKAGVGKKVSNPLSLPCNSLNQLLPETSRRLALPDRETGSQLHGFTNGNRPQRFPVRGAAGFLV